MINTSCQVVKIGRNEKL